MEWSERDQYFFMRLSEMVYLVVIMGMVLTSEIFPGGRPRYIRLRVVKFDIDDTVTCLCKYHKRVGVPRSHIIAFVGDVLCSMIDVRWINSLQAYFGLPGFDKITIILLKALKCKKNPCRCIRPVPSVTYPVCFGYAAENYVVPYEKDDHSYRSFLELKVYVNALKPAKEQVVFEEEVFGEGYFPEDDSEDEFDKEFRGVGKAKTRMSTFKQIITVECEMDFPMKPHEVLT
jgi:hypothetical protein